MDSRLALLVLFASTAPPGNAITVATDLGPGNTFQNNNAELIENHSIRGEVTGFAASFLPAVTATLLDVKLPLFAVFGNTLTVGIASDASGQPGSVITYLTQNGGIVTYPSGPTLVTFNCASNCSLLQAGTTYWIVAVASDSLTDAYWYFSPSAVGNGFFSNGSGNLGVVSGPWSTAGSTFPTPGFLVDGTVALQAPALSESAMVLVAALLAFLGAWTIPRESRTNRPRAN